MEPLKTTKPWKSEIWQLRLGSGPQGLIVINVSVAIHPRHPQRALVKKIYCSQLLDLWYWQGEGWFLTVFDLHVRDPE